MMHFSVSAFRWFTIKKITLCADDYAQNIAISEGIIRLAELGRISATSCMVNSDAWNDTYSALQVIYPTTYVGLHVNLTHGIALSDSWKNHYGAQFPGLARLLMLAYSRQLNPAVIAAECHAQWDAYSNAMNVMPDFIDGHQHVHQLPLIRDAILSVYADRSLSGTTIRKTTQGWRDLVVKDGFLKRQLIMLLGGIELNKRLTALNIPTNTSFSGIYNFKQSTHYRKYFQSFLRYSQDNGLIMCHPGQRSNDTTDPLNDYRHHELAYFLSDDFLNDLTAHSFQLKRKEA